MNYFKYNDVDVVLLSQISSHYDIKVELLRSIYYRKRNILIEGEHYFVARGKDVKLFIREYSPNYYCSAKVSLWTKDGVNILIEMAKSALKKKEKIQEQKLINQQLKEEKIKQKKYKNKLKKQRERYAKQKKEKERLRKNKEIEELKSFKLQEKEKRAQEKARLLEEKRLKRIQREYNKKLKEEERERNKYRVKKTKLIEAESPFIYEGSVFRTFNELSEYVAVTKKVAVVPRTFKAQLKKGLSIDEIIEKVREIKGFKS